MDDLARIERAYGSVAEYARQREEADNAYWSEYFKNMEYAKTNKIKLEKAGERAMYFCEDCFGCKHYEDVGPTFYGSIDIDDVPHGICHHKGTPLKDVVEPFCKGKEIIENVQN